jgi:hypothetical protein
MPWYMHVPRIVRIVKFRWSGLVVRTKETRNAYRILILNHFRKRLPGKPRKRWEECITIDRREMGFWS